MVVGSVAAITNPPSELDDIVAQGNPAYDRYELCRHATPDTGRTVENSRSSTHFADAHASEDTPIELEQEVLSTSLDFWMQEHVADGLCPGTSLHEFSWGEWRT